MMKRALLASSQFGLAALAVFACAFGFGKEGDSNNQISTHRADYRRTGFFEGELGSSDLELVFVVADFEYLLAYDAKDGREVWKVKTAGAACSPIVRRGVLYVGPGINSRGDDLHVYAMDALRGTVIRKWKTDSQAGPGSMLFHQDTLLVLADDTHLYCFDGDSSARVWRTRTDCITGSTFTAYDGEIYLGGRVLDVRDGTHKLISEETARSECRRGTAPIVLGELIILACKEKIYCLNRSDHAHRWTAEPAEPPDDPGAAAFFGVWGAMAYDDGILIVKFGRQYLYGIDCESGRTKWKLEIGTSGKEFRPIDLANAIDPSCPAIDGKLVIAFDAKARELRAYDIKNGKSIWGTSLGGAEVLMSSPAIARGRVYVGTMAGVLYCLSAEDGSVHWTAKGGEHNITGSPTVASGVTPQNTTR